MATWHRVWATEIRDKLATAISQVWLDDPDNTGASLEAVAEVARATLIDDNEDETLLQRSGGMPLDDMDYEWWDELQGDLSHVIELVEAAQHDVDEFIGDGRAWESDEDDSDATAEYVEMVEEYVTQLEEAAEAVAG